VSQIEEAVAMPVRSPRNEYKGVNAHLHSYFQTHGGWDGFHNKHIGDLGAEISRWLPPGYLVDTEQSLQLREISPYGDERIRRWRPDIAIYGASTVPQSQSDTEVGIATLVQPLLDTLSEEDNPAPSALLIYKVTEDALLGRPITQIELLSPSNKHGDGLLLYKEKRIALVNAGINLVEIDYLHETDSVVRGVPSYTRHEADAHPYNFTVSTPSPTLRDGKAVTTFFDVDSKIPLLKLPLGGSDVLSIDLNSVYRTTFESVNAYSYRVDYAQLPEHFEAYNLADQARIHARMSAVQEANPN
jgi:hypothetical protein